MSKYKYFPDNAEELNSIALGYEFWKTLDEHTHGHKVGTEYFQSMYKEISKERDQILKIVTERELKLVRSGVIVN